jgi:crotonobetainyl-CoA:carnitine CoA-transferase CaiB-like acyl-CoA transferase
MGGTMVTQGGGPGCEPRVVVPGIADQTGGIFLAYGISMALIARERFGVGQQVDSSLYGGQIALLAANVTGALRMGAHQRTRPQGSPVFKPYGCADDKWLCVAILDPAVYPRLCAALGRPDLATDERFAEPFNRWANADALEVELTAVFRSGNRDEWLERMIAHDLPCSPVQDFADVGNDPQALTNGYVTTVEHPNLGTLKVVGSPVRLTETPASVRMPAPELGQHTEELLLELGYDWETIAKLRTDEII